MACTCLAALLVLPGCTDEDSVSTGVFSATTIDVEAFTDPQIPAVTCHISSVKAHLSLSDPSNMAIACRQTGPLYGSQAYRENK
jgi:CreA protein